MKLKFLAVAGAHVPERHQDGASMARPNGGGAFRYVGRVFDPSAPDEKYPVSSTPYECESDTGEANYLIRCCRDRDLLPADEATARVCGVPFSKSKSAPSGAKGGDS